MPELPEILQAFPHVTKEEFDALVEATPDDDRYRTYLVDEATEPAEAGGDDA